MKLPLLLAAFVCAMVGPSPPPAPQPERARLAGLGDSIPALFLKLANDALKGRIASRDVHLDAPATVILQDAVLYDPDGAEVARVKRASATLSLSSLLAGDVVISRVDLQGALLTLKLHDKKLNLLEALTPKKPPDKSKPNNAAFRIDAITARGSSFTFTDEENVTVTADDIGANASLEVDLAHDLVIVDVKQPSIKRGMVRLKQLDVPVENVQAVGVRVLKDKVELTGVIATAAGATVSAAGSIVVTDPGSLNLHGTVDAPRNAWPEKLKRLPFDTPAIRAKVDVIGPFTDPHVLADGSFGRAEAYGYVVDAGRGVIDVNKDLVRIKDGTYVKAGGVVGAVGTVTLPELVLDLKVKATDVPLAQALRPANLDPPPKGTVSGRANLSGIADGEKPILVEASAVVHRGEVYGVHVRGDASANATVTVKPSHVVIDGATLRGDRLEAHVSGDVYTDEERVVLKLNAAADDAAALVESVPDEIKIDRAAFDGSIIGPYKSVVVDGRFTVPTGRAYGVPVRTLEGHLAASAAEVLIDRATATAAEGALALEKPIYIRLKENKAITGVLSLTHGNLASIKSTKGEPYPVAGLVDAVASLAGPYDDPRVSVRAAGGGLEVSGEKLGQGTARAVVTKKLLAVSEAQVEGPLLRAHTDDVRLRIDTMVVDGHAHVDTIELSAIEAAKSAELSGTAKGLVIVRGDVYAPDVLAKLTAEDVAVGKQHFGAGSMTVTLTPDAIEPKKKNHVVGVSAYLVSNLGIWDLSTSYAVERKIVNAHANVVDVDFSPFTTQLGTSVAPLEGFASGTLDASGPLDHLDMRLRLRAPEVAVAHQGIESEKAPAAEGTKALVLRPLGPLLVDARMDDGNLNARVCAFTATATAPEAGPARSTAASPGARASTASKSAPPSQPGATSQAPTEVEVSPCGNGERVWANIVGPVDLANGSFDLAVEGQIEEDSLEDLFPALASRGLAVGAKAHADAQLVREEGKPVDVRAEATLLDASVQPQGSLKASLVGTAEILYADRRVQLVTPARFAAPSGEVDVVVGGSVGTDDIALDVNGSVALAIAKAFTTQIANASGTAETSLAVRGRYDTGVTIEGSFTPTPGAVVTPRSLGQAITFEGGSVRFAPIEGAADGMIRVTAQTVRAKVGDGDLTLKGTADVRTAKKTDQGLVSHWDLTASGTGLAFKLATGRAEGALDLALEGDEAKPLLRGRVEVTDGLYRKTLELRNFVLQAPPEKASEPLWVTLTPLGLENLELDVALSMSNFRARANVANFNADMHLRGNLHLKNTLRLPQLDGAVEVEEGTVDFPRARFEVVEMQVEFPTTGDGRLNPLVHMTARAELPPGAAGTNDTEIPVDLFLDGDLESGINLDLSATDPQREWTRAELLGLILFGKTLDSTVADRDTSLAVRALMSEAAAPITSELESLAAKTLGVEIELDPGGWRWQIGRRLQLEGPGILVNQPTSATAAEQTGVTNTAAAATATASSSTAPTSDDAVRLRLLIYDHLPLGKNLSLEGRQSSAGSDLRLSLRLFEE